MVVLFSQALLKIFRAPAFSCSFLFCFFLFIVIAILPFFLGFATYDFWKARQFYLEQPQVLYRKELLITVYSEQESVSGSSLITSPSVQFFSTLGSINRMYYESLSPMTIVSSLLDYNFDGYAEMYDFNITVYTDPSNIKSIKILSFYDYQIRDRIKMDLVGLAYSEVNTPAGAAYVYIDGDLEFIQKNLMKPSPTINSDYNYSVLSTSSASENFLPTLLLVNNDRNFTTNYNYNYMVAPRGLDSSCKISMKVRIPVYQKYEYAPGFLEVMKFAWVQYVSLLIPIGYLIYRFAGFIYRNQILESHVTYEMKVINK